MSNYHYYYDYSLFTASNGYLQPGYFNASNYLQLMQNRYFILFFIIYSMVMWVPRYLAWRERKDEEKRSGGGGGGMGGDGCRRSLQYMYLLDD